MTTRKSLLVAQSRLALLQGRARALETGPARTHEVELALEGLYGQIEALDQQIAAGWRDRAWGGR
jgi:hypothetical protein